MRHEELDETAATVYEGIPEQGGSLGASRREDATRDRREAELATADYIHGFCIACSPVRYCSGNSDYGEGNADEQQRAASSAGGASRSHDLQARSPCSPAPTVCR
jgi:hypothetical protein